MTESTSVIPVAFAKNQDIHFFIWQIIASLSIRIYQDLFVVTKLVIKN